MPINLTGPAMEVARIGSILKASKAKQAEEAAKAAAKTAKTEQIKLKKAQVAEINKYIDLFKDMPTQAEWSKMYNNPDANAWRKGWERMTQWNQPKVQQGLQTAAKAQAGKEASANMRIAHKENVYKGGKRF